ncbi:MAG: LysR substrate-binding domain-containing protein [Pseudomonadota bacterium]
MELHQLKAFTAVANARGFTAAAAALGVAPSSITRAVAGLEKTLGVRLFQRTTRSVTLTEAGQRFYDRISAALEEINAAVEQVDETQSVITGNLRVAASVSFGQVILAPVIKQFIDANPQISIELVLSDAAADLVSDGIDLAVRHGALSDSSLIARRLCDVSYRLVAAPDYLNRAPAIKHPRDINAHRLITYPYPSFRSQWKFERGTKQQVVNIEPAIRISNASALLACARSGGGLALLADWLVDQDLRAGDLVRVLPGWAASGDNLNAALWMITPSRQFVPARTKALIRFIQQVVKDKSN